MSGRLARFLGDSPLRVFLRLLVLSFIVGLVLSALNIRPSQVYFWIERTVTRIYDMGFEFVEEGLNYLVVGALIVIPIFVVMRLFKMGSGGHGE